ncbi:MAG: SNF2-related protein, partial [Bacteroidales bacterium]
MNINLPGSIKQQLNSLSRQSATSAGLAFRQGQSLYVNGQCSPLSMADRHYEFSVDDKYRDYLVKIDANENIHSSCTCSTAPMCRHRVAALMQLHELLKIESEDISAPGIRYTRKGMIKRVIEERKEKARLASYRIEFADNIFGEHILTNERGISYNLTFRDIERRHGYCSCPDYRTNKLGTCKHLIHAFENLQDHPGLIPEQLPEYPFIEVFLNPFRDNKISWFYPEKLTGEIAELFYRYFGNNKFVEDEEVERLVGFFRNAEKHKQILVRPEVHRKVEQISEKAALERLKKERKPDFSLIKADLFPYQVEGVEFATFKTGAVIADEMGLGKTVQAIATAVMKKDIFGFGRTLIVCPATIKFQWKSEIEQYTNEKAVVVEGTPEEREKIYRDEEAYFLVVNYETLIRDHAIILKNPPDFIILDEAQRIKNYASVTSAALKAIPKKHALVITGTPIESRLIDLYSIILFVEPELLSPLWEFSYQHCYFDQIQKNRIVGYYDLQELNRKLTRVMLRREKHQVIGQLPKISEINIPVKLHPYQQKQHIELAREAITVYRKKILTTYDIQRMVVLVKKMRMLGDSTFLIDDSTNISPKLDELR